ncbi:MAG: type I DNA topoisomerase, partial [Candidatus Paceibacterota bacterium]
MKLVIVESPSKEKTIEKYLGDDYVVKASVGHVRDLPKSKKDAIDIKKGFKPHYVVSPKKKKVIEELAKKAKKADEILLATDPDREGEAIAWHVMEVLSDKHDIDRGKFKRVSFNEITKEAVLEAIKKPRKIDEDLLKAQEARRVLDRLVGYDLSGLIWKKLRYGLSAGRVQSPALRLIAEREREIRAFKPEDYWVITADVSSPKKEEFELSCSEEPRDKDLVDKILEVGKKEDWIVSEIQEKKAKRNPYAPFKTSTLQQAASSRLGFSPARTMVVAQQLYEAGLITYMRTDSTTLSKQALGQIAEVVKEKFGDKYYQARKYSGKSKSAQEAHEAIRPSNVSLEEAGSKKDQKRLYKLIWKRAISSQMAPAEILRTKIITKVGDGNIPDFSVNGSRTLFEGWLKADPKARGDDVEIPELDEGDELSLIEMHVEDKQTQPPSRYSEARLVKELEKRGIGRPSTYASIIKTLLNRSYVTKEGRALHPTDTGEVVSEFLEENFEEYISDDFTAEMEDELDEIAAGEASYEETLEEFYT